MLRGKRSFLLSLLAGKAADMSLTDLNRLLFNLVTLVIQLCQQVMRHIFINRQFYLPLAASPS